jgi:hypothetical protein
MQVDLELVLAIDISRSIDAEEQSVQRRGYVDAFRHRAVVDAIVSGPTGRIAVTYIEWSEPAGQSVLVPWTLIDSARAAARFADALAAAPMRRWKTTSISAGLEFAAEQFDRNGYFGARQVIDVSGDGPNNFGAPVIPARDRIVDRGIVINGLPIMVRQRPAVDYLYPELDIYFEECVVGGPGAFVITVQELSQFADAIRQKLVLEIASRQLAVVPVAFGRGPRTDCLIGEKLRGKD